MQHTLSAVYYETFKIRVCVHPFTYLQISDPAFSVFQDFTAFENAIEMEQLEEFLKL